MGFLSKLFAGSPPTPQSATFERPFIIRNPTIGFRNLLGEPGGELALHDGEALGPMFTAWRLCADAAPPCDVLFLYCALDEEGRIVGAASSLHDLIQEAGAQVAVVAAENPHERYALAYAMPKGAARPANVVMTVRRRDPAFCLFFGRLFDMMLQGASMLSAWTALAPRIPGHDAPDCPVTLMAAEAGHLAFGQNA